ncbi:DUF3786 domain-containing protein [Romboutsia maritimum]|uniref:DUF3786 domain-containing protein n=1 Tax=Romboutsia maritimum TaxID=2020948 RepID=A0A371IRK5_9FIRM|nr:DUF3786 domain-containing protein [Romboutsia maritimum]RDY23116.1 DUF3786 domain-containing protein [Romboutsia maritimum]
MKNNYYIAYEKEWKGLKKRKPEDVADIANISYCKIKNQFKVPFLNLNYILDCNNESIYRESDGYIPDIESSIMILNYLTFSKLFHVPNNNWVSLKEIPNGGALFYPAFYKSSILELIKSFGKDLKKFERSSKALNGIPTTLGDASYIFKVFPKVMICVVLWEGDEEISPNATILFKPSIEHLMHIESIIGLGSYIAGKLIKY